MSSDRASFAFDIFIQNFHRKKTLKLIMSFLPLEVKGQV